MNENPPEQRVLSFLKIIILEYSGLPVTKQVKLKAVKR
jgi:hypothetical protein